jgi:8-hydroxy-5-deazaflavin:NADPH oxidoreductase
MQIAIIGTGKMGKGIAYALRETSHDITFGSREAGRAESLAKVMGEEHARHYHGTTYAAAASRADVIFIAIPFDVAEKVVAELVTAMGFGAVDAGRLRVARTIERMTVLIIDVAQRHGYGWNAGFKILH